MFIQEILGEQRRQALSNAAMEALAIVAYKQPITRGQVEYIRGQNQLRTGFVHSSYVVFYNEDNENDLLLFSYDENITLYQVETQEEFQELNEVLHKFDEEQAKPKSNPSNNYICCCRNAVQRSLTTHRHCRRTCLSCG